MKNKIENLVFYREGKTFVRDTWNSLVTAALQQKNSFIRFSWNCECHFGVRHTFTYNILLFKKRKKVIKKKQF